MPVIGQGSWNIETADRASAIAALRRGIDLGMTHIDSAEMYGSGAAERIIAQAVACALMAMRQPRDDRGTS